MQWDATPRGGFTTGEPWLPLIDPDRRNVADQAADPGSLLTFLRRLAELRKTIEGELRFLETGHPDVIAYERGEHVVTLNLSDEPRPEPSTGKPLVATHPGNERGAVPPHGGTLHRRAA
jgi:glycosidase